MRILTTVACIAASDAAASQRPPPSARIDQRLGERAPLELEFADSTGKKARLSDFFGSRPVALILGYHDCPTLCGIALDAASHSLAALPFEPGVDYDVIFASIDPMETPRLAAANKRAYARRFGRPGAEAGFHFLTGDEASVRALADAVGFRYAYDEASQQYAHASGLMILTPDGALSKYFYGIEYKPRDLRLALVEASAGEIGSAVDQLLLLCYHYNPISGKYGLAIGFALRVAGGAAALGLGAYVGGALWRERRGRSGIERNGDERP